MRKRILTALIALTVVTSGLAGVTAAETSTDAELAQQSDAASVTFENQTTGGDEVVVDSVTLPEGGYVTIHGPSLADGDTLGSVAGTSQYLEPGTHDNVTVTLTDPVSEGSYTAMAHRETDGDRTYEFVASNASVDGPYTADGGAVVDSATVTPSATVSMSDQPTTGDSVVVDRVVLSEGGFVTIHDDTVLDGQTFESIRGTSQYLSAGVHEDVRVSLDDPVTENTTLVPMAHRDTDGDQNYTFDTSEGAADGPYTNADGAVVDTAAVTVGQNATATMSDQVTGGSAVTVDAVYVPEGGFVTIHDGTLLEGETFDSVRGTSTYLEAGYHTDVTVTLDSAVENDTTLIAMPHMDTDGDQNYTFVESDGSADGPYTDGDGAVVDPANVTVSATVTMDSQLSGGNAVVVDSVDMSEGGFVAIHDATLLDGATFDSIRGTSIYLGPGTHEDVSVTLDEPLSENTTLVPMAHRDTDGDEAYTFEESGGSADGPYATSFAPGAVVATGDVTVQTMDDGDMGGEQMTETMTGMTEGTAVQTTDSSGPGFTVIVALLALVAAALLAARSQR